MPATYLTGNDQSYPVGNCCAIANLRNFYSDKYFDPNIVRNEEDRKRCMNEMVKAVEDSCAFALSKGKSIVFATVCSDQKIAEELLIKEGFVSFTEDWIYRDPATSQYKTGVKMYTKLLYTPKG